jgi:hypothetical protein
MYKTQVCFLYVTVSVYTHVHVGLYVFMGNAGVLTGKIECNNQVTSSVTINEFFQCFYENLLQLTYCP